MKRLFVPAALFAAVLASAGLTACTPGTRYVDLVFSSTTMSTATYKQTTDLTTGGPLALVTDVYQPAGDTFAKRPAIVWIHGGGFKGGDRSKFTDVAKAYARRGYVTLSIEYRLDPGNRCQAVQDGEIPPEQLAAETARCERAITAAKHDAQSSVVWLRTKATTYKVDPTRIAVGGGSAGAITALNVGQQSNPDGGAVPANLRVGAVLAMSGCQYDLTSIDRNDAPVAMLASGGDQAVPYSCSVATVDAARAAGTPVSTMYYPHESAHAQQLYKDHQAAVDKSWTSFLITQLRLP